MPEMLQQLYSLLSLYCCTVTTQALLLYLYEYTSTTEDLPYTAIRNITGMKYQVH